MLLLKSGNCRKRKIQTLGLIFVIVLIYYILQLFSLSRLGHKLSEKKLHFQAKDVNIKLLDRPEVSDDSDEGGVDSMHKDSGAGLLTRTIPRGVHPSDAVYYAETPSGMFKCLTSELNIPAQRVNDDFCDCPDSSDEPGTSACPNGRFYCKVQLPHRDEQFVHSSKVNDGICDCCDGSDEWAGHSVPSPVRLRGNVGAVFHTPCTDHCGDILNVMENEKRIRRKGLLLQKRYIDASRNLDLHKRQKYGPAGIFYLLSQECYKHSALEYVYTICPFSSVKQSSGPVTSTVLGRQGKWTKQKSGDFVLQMGGGDAALCPDGNPREARIRFLCGLEDRVIDIKEEQKCHYDIRFSTPAAC